MCSNQNPERSWLTDNRSAPGTSAACPVPSWRTLTFLSHHLGVFPDALRTASQKHPYALPLLALHHPEGVKLGGLHVALYGFPNDASHLRRGNGVELYGTSGSLAMGVAIPAKAEYAANLSTNPGGSPMTRRQTDPLRPLTDDERNWLVRVARSQTEPAAHVARAKALLAIVDGESYTDAAKAAGRRSGEAVSRLVSRFNREGIAAVEPRHGGGPPILYTEAERERILSEARRKPQCDTDGTATWSLTALRRALREADDGLPGVSTHTIWKTLKEAGFDWQKNRSWCETGVVERKRGGEVVTVVDPDAQAKKS